MPDLPARISAGDNLTTGMPYRLAMSAANAVQMAYKTSLFQNYSQDIPKNDNLIASSKKLHEIAEGLVQQYEQEGKVSGLFCKLKYTNIENSAALIQHVVGSRPR